MPRFPYMNFPFPFYKTQSPNPYEFNKPSSSISHTNKINSSPNTNSTNIDIPKTACNNTTSENNGKKNKSNNNTCDYLFDLLGLKIYSDDVLLISLIYFLYSEGVKDDGLFLVLVLLLLS